VDELYLESRLDFLRSVQNADGGWGYFPGKQSWLEPTTYAMLALHGTPGSEERLRNAWKLVSSWQTPDGSFRPTGQVSGGTWITAHTVTLACVLNTYDDSVRKSVEWLLRVAGVESSLTTRFIAQLHIVNTKMDFSHKGWPWREGNSSWIEPTVHTLVALKKVASQDHRPQLRERIREGEAHVFSRRCSDGGWNCGASNVLGIDLPSYPETTALALLGLQGRSARELAVPLQVARRFRQDTKSSLAKAWLAVALRCHGENVDAPPNDAKVLNDVMLSAIEALGHPSGNFQFLRTGGLV
jgi:Prenyltransferase and squalene oxidase repeat